MDAVWKQHAKLDTATERERCAALADTQAGRFEKMKMYPVARAMRALAVQIRNAERGA